VGFRYRKQIKLLPGVKLNVSKSGISTSVGKPGATLNFSKRGMRTTLGIPGTGLSYSTSVSKKRNANSSTSSRITREEARKAAMDHLGLTRREANRFVRDAIKRPKKLLGKSDEEIAAYYKRNRLTSNQKVFLLVLLLIFLVYAFFSAPTK